MVGMVRVVIPKIEYVWGGVCVSVANLTCEPLCYMLTYIRSY